MSLIDELIALLGRQHAIGPEDIEARYLDDETGGVAGAAVGLVRPGSTEEVAAVLRLCHTIGQPIVIQGGRTGMTRAALPRAGELIMSLERLNAIEAIDRVAGTMTLGAGCILSIAQDAAADAGWRLAVDIGARGSCTIGGMIATNAGGHQVIRFGMMREQMLGVEAVLADGTIVSAMSGVLKNNTGYDLKQLFAGSEGTLGVVTRAVLRLRSPPIGRETALCALNSYETVTRLLARIDHLLPGQLTAFELMWSDFVDAACALPGNSYPFARRHGFFVLVETEVGSRGRLNAALDRCFEDDLIVDAVIAQSERDHHRLWAIRDAIGPLVEQMKLVEPFDVSAPLRAIGDVVDRVAGRLATELPGARALFFGHVADGNLHLALELADEVQRHPAEKIVYDTIRNVGGSVSAEHGIGMLKREWLGHSRSQAEIAMMASIRNTLDPKCILNPNRIF